MGARGRNSAAELSVVSTISQRRPKPPADLTPEQAEEWRAVVSRLDPGWFPRETHGILAQYCVHVAERKDIDLMISEMKGNPDFDLKEYDQLLKMREREGRAASSLATRMRLTQQATYDPKKKKAGQAKKAWED